MARRNQLRTQRTGTVINATAKQQETDLIKALNEVAKHLDVKFPGVNFVHEKTWRLRDIVQALRKDYPEVDFHYHFNRSNIRPDGGFLYMQASHDNDLAYPILISEVKNQGDKRPSRSRRVGEASTRQRH